MNKLTASILSIASTLAALSVGSIAQAQSMPRYVDAAPAPEISPVSDPVIFGTDAEGTTHFAAAGFISDSTPDGNLFVTRIVGQEQDRSISTQLMQVDCGRAMYRIVLLRLNGESVPYESRWANLSFDRTKFSAQIMLRTCEAAATDRGGNWTWVSR